MKLKNCLTLSKFNLKGSKKKNSVLVMMVLTVVAITVLAGFLNVVNDIVLKSESRLSMRQILIFPTTVYPEITLKGVTKENINEVLDIEHVLSCESEPYSHETQFVDYLKITDENENEITNSKEIFNAEWLSENLYMQQVDADFSAKSFTGKQLKDAPAMSCIIPDRLSIWDAETESSSIIEIPYEELIGKTLTVSCDYLIHNFEEVKDGAYTGEYEFIGEITYNLKVVGAFHYDYASSLVSMQISDETARKIEAMAIEQAVQNNPDALYEYRNDPYARDQIVTVDKYENVSEVEKKLNDLGFSAVPMGGLADYNIKCNTRKK